MYLLYSRRRFNIERKAYMDNKETIQTTIDALVKQIEMLSHRSQMEANRKVPKVNLMEYSSIILQLSRTLSELIVIQRALEDNQYDQLSGLINGRMR